MLSTLYLQAVRASTPVARASRSTLGSHTRSTREHGLPSRDNILRCIVISIMGRATLWTRPRTHGQRQLVHDVATAATSFTTGIEPINLDERPAVPFGLVFELTKDLPPAHIRDMLGQCVVLHHAFDVQVFRDDHLVFVYQSGRHLVDKVHPAVHNFLMDLRDFQAGLVAVLRVFLLVAQLPLRAGQLLFVFPRMAGVADLLPRREGGCVGQPNVNPELLLNGGQRLHIDLTPQTDVVPAALGLRDRDRAQHMGNVSRPLDLEPANLGQLQIFVAGVPRKGRLGILRRLPVMLRFKRGILGAPFPEIHEGGLQMAQRLLQRHTTDLVQIGHCGLLLPSRQVCTCRVVIDALLAFIPRFRPQVKRVVVRLTHTPEGLCQQGLLFLRGVASKLQPDNLHSSQDSILICEHR
jgi:hypothetical protein